MSAESETVRRKTESLRESVFTGVQASPPNRNSFHVSSPLPACPYTNVYGGEAESPPDVISSTFTYNHTEKQHGFRCDGLKCLQYTNLCTVVFTYTESTGFKQGLGDNSDKATKTELITILWQLPL